MRLSMNIVPRDNHNEEGICLSNAEDYRLDYIVRSRAKIDP